MDKNLYDLMDWAAIEEITYSECDRPKKILGSQRAVAQNVVVQRPRQKL